MADDVRCAVPDGEHALKCGATLTISGGVPTKIALPSSDAYNDAMDEAEALTRVWIEEGDERPVRQGGPETCPRPCDECAGGGHHFADPMIEFAESEPDHEAAKLGIAAWYVCKHCDAWREYPDEDGEEADDDDGQRVVHVKPLEVQPTHWLKAEGQTKLVRLVDLDIAGGGEGRYYSGLFTCALGREEHGEDEDALGWPPFLKDGVWYDGWTGEPIEGASVEPLPADGQLALFEGL